MQKTASTPRAMHRLVLALASGAALVVSLSACVPLVVGGAAVEGVGMSVADRPPQLGRQLDDQGIEHAPRPACATSPTTRCTSA